MTQMIVALDVPSFDDAKAVVEKLEDSVSWYKVGKQLFTAVGPDILRFLKDEGKSVFLDMKYHDIPNTVAQAIKSAAKIGADIINVHASGGPVMLKAAAEAAEETGKLVIAVTVLTSMDQGQLNAIGISASPAEHVAKLAKLTQESGLRGVVCSPQEIELVKGTCGNDFITVVPGIRPAGAAINDQKRIMTPEMAAKAGAEFIVVGRPVLAAEAPAAAARAITASLT